MIYQATAPAKIILCGEHAVVYNEPAIAIPVSSLRAAAYITTGQPSFSMISAQTSEYLTVQNTDHPYIQLIKQIVADTDTGIPDIEVKIDSQIPPASGFGSGAAVATAITRALLEYLGQSLQKKRVNKYVYEAEKHFHGSPSGIDNTTIVYEQPIFYVKDEGFSVFSSQESLSFLIANSGKKAPTSETVGDVRRIYDENPTDIQPIIKQIGQLTHNVRDAILTGDEVALGQLLTENHQLLRRLTVSNSTLDHLVQTAQNAGALGAKLSGAGRGGNMLALVTSAKIDAVKAALYRAGATAVYQTTLQ